MAENLQREVEQLRAKIADLEERRQKQAAEHEAQLSSVNFHKTLLAKEVLKLRQEVASLKQARDNGGTADAADGADENESLESQLKSVKAALSRVQQEKADALASATSHKAILAKEVKTLRAEAARAKHREEVLMGQLRAERGEEAANSIHMMATSGDSVPGLGVAAGASADDMLAAFEKKQKFELLFVKQVVDLRRALSETALRTMNASGEVPLGVRQLLQLSNERIDKVLREINKIPTEDKLQAESLKLLAENAKLRKGLNDYAEGLLSRTFSKLDDFEHGKYKTDKPYPDRICNPEKLFSW